MRIHGLGYMCTCWPDAVSGRARGSTHALLPHLPFGPGNQAADIGSCQADLTSSGLDALPPILVTPHPIFSSPGWMHKLPK